MSKCCLKINLLAGLTLAAVSALAHAQPSNDACASAQAVVVPSATPGTTIGSTLDVGVQTCTVSYNTPGVWYRVVGTGRSIAVDVCTATYDTKLFVFCTSTANCGAPSALTCVGGSDDSFSCADVSRSRVQFCSLGGQDYYVLVSGFGGETGNFTLNVADAGACANPVSCEVQGACCSAIGTCTRTTQEGCPGSWTPAGVCSPNPCVGACCNTSTGACSITLANACSGSFLGLGISCTPDRCRGACCVSAGTCSLTGPTGCTGVFSGLNTSCSPSPCSPAGAPANDLCANATAFTGAGFSASGTSLLSSTDPSPAICATSSADVWYAFTPSISGNFSVNLCGSAIAWDSTLSIHTACPTASVSNLLFGACNDDGCVAGSGLSAISSIALNAGTTYLIRVAGYGQSGANVGDFSLSVGEVTGTCCNAASGVCAVSVQAACLAPNVWTAGAVCDTLTCAAFQGACCDPASGACVLAFASGCASPLSFQGPATLCAPNNPCPIPTGACCLPGGACQLAAITQCIGTSIFQGAGVVCSAVTCPAGPTNDLCEAATVAVLGSNAGSIAAASSEGSAFCGQSGARDVFFTFTAPSTGGYRFDMCTTAVASWDAILSVHAACPATFLTQLSTSACDDDSCGAIGGFARIGELDLASGQTCIIRVAGYNDQTVGGPFTLTISQVPMGACCDPAAPCAVTTASTCFGIYLGDGTTCEPTTCPPLGACCDALTGACTIATAIDCSQPGVYQGDTSLCEPNPCPLSGSCCGGPNNPCCTITTQAACGGTWTFLGACSPGECAPPSNDEPLNAAVIALNTPVNSSNCNATDSSDGAISPCQSLASRGMWYAFTAPATAFYKISTCGSPQDTVLTVFTAGLDSVLACDDDTCDVSGGSGSALAAEIGSLRVNQGTTIRIRVSSYGTNVPGGEFTLAVAQIASFGACCSVSGQCTTTDAASCTSSFAVNAVCDPNPCPPPPGACCSGAACSVVAATACNGPAQSFLGPETTCNPPGNRIAPCCVADFNHDGAIALVDIFDFLNAWFAQSSMADVTASGSIDVDDIFEYLDAWFNGCSGVAPQP